MCAFRVTRANANPPAATCLPARKPGGSASPRVLGGYPKSATKNWPGIGPWANTPLTPWRPILARECLWSRDDHIRDIGAGVLPLIPHPAALVIDAAVHHGGDAVMRQNRPDGPYPGRVRHNFGWLGGRHVCRGATTTEAVIAPFGESTGCATLRSGVSAVRALPSRLGRSASECHSLGQTELADLEHDGSTPPRERPERRTPHTAGERRLDDAQRRQDDGENDQRGTHPSRSSDAGETARNRKGIASVGDRCADRPRRKTVQTHHDGTGAVVS
jgi:hypothetical protein